MVNFKLFYRKNEMRLKQVRADAKLLFQCFEQQSNLKIRKIDQKFFFFFLRNITKKSSNTASAMKIDGFMNRER